MLSSADPKREWVVLRLEPGSRRDLACHAEAGCDVIVSTGKFYRIVGGWSLHGYHCTNIGMTT